MTGEYATYIPLLDENDVKFFLANYHNLISKNEEFSIIEQKMDFTKYI